MINLIRIFIQFVTCIPMFIIAAIWSFLLWNTLYINNVLVYINTIITNEEIIQEDDI